MSVQEILQSYLQDVQYLNWKFSVFMDDDRPYLQLGFWEQDARSTGELVWQTSRKWLLSPHMTKSEVVQTAFKAVMTAVEHETREKFCYKKQPIFNPHYNVDLLFELCSKGDSVLDVRKTKEEI